MSATSTPVRTLPALRSSAWTKRPNNSCVRRGQPSQSNLDTPPIMIMTMKMNAAASRTSSSSVHPERPSAGRVSRSAGQKSTGRIRSRTSSMFGIPLSSALSWSGTIARRTRLPPCLRRSPRPRHSVSPISWRFTLPLSTARGSTALRSNSVSFHATASTDVAGISPLVRRRGPPGTTAAIIRHAQSTGPSPPPMHASNSRACTHHFTTNTVLVGQPARPRGHRRACATRRRPRAAS